MFEYIRGKVTVKRVDYVALEVNGVAYRVHISLNTYEKLKNEEERLFIHSYIREDAFVLYGFYETRERELFEKLLSVSGVGAKLAIAILSTFTVRDLKQMIVSEDEKMLTKVPGLGIKKAKKLILEVKDKININLTLEDDTEQVDFIKTHQLEEDIYLALEALGYKQKDLEKFVSRNEIKNYSDIEEAIKDILKKIQGAK